MVRFYFLLGSFFILTMVKAQVSNNDYKLGAINIALPKTPESQAFEKYGNIPVSELTGSVNFSVPLFTVKSKFIQVPLTLNYSPGIKVSQEASWTGLGFDLISGGRITVETKGNIDNPNTSSSMLKNGMQRIFNRLGNSNSLNLLTYASICWECDTSVTHDVPDPDHAVADMALLGLGEPDIYHINFLGNSLNIFFDKITDSIRYIGEKSLFEIGYNRNGNGQIVNWIIKDNKGVSYTFDQIEYTTLALPPVGSFTNNTSATAWLLTKILHPTGDSVKFTYANFGNSYPVTDWSASMSWREATRTLSYSSDINQNSVTQQPNYLTKIETGDVRVDFILGSREDIKGTGSKRLDEIRVTDKIANVQKSKISFSYDYFVSSLGSCYTSLPDSVTKYYKNRLKLNAITVHDSSNLEPPYRFYYYLEGSFPDKKSFAIDHWGYYNSQGYGTYMYPCSPQNLIPNTGLGTDQNYAPLNGYAVSRECNPLSLPLLSMDSVVYPTGGSTKFIYEPHQSTRLPTIPTTGGGLRIKTIKNYASGKLATANEYTYSTGIYMGTIQYWTSNWGMYPIGATVNTPPDQDDSKMDNLSANGVINENDLLIAYSSVRITQKDAKGQTNGYVIKHFNVPAPSLANNAGLATQAAHWPAGTIYDSYGGGWEVYLNNTDRLYPANAGYAPTPTRQLDGKLIDEQYFDRNDQLVKSINYYYSQVDYSQKFYSIKVSDNWIGAPGASGNKYFDTYGDRRYQMLVSPAKSYFTLTDSVVEKLYDGSNFITQKRAFKYNSYFQPEYITSYNSDGTQTITYTRTSLDFKPNYNLAPTGEALLIYNLKSNHIYDLPVEQTQMRRTVAGDSLVVRSRSLVYQNGLPLKEYSLETDVPLTYRIQFIPLYANYTGYPGAPSGSSYTLQRDAKYNLYSSADYSSQNQVKTLHTQELNTSYIWDEDYDDLLAQCVNADSAHIAFSSFETGSKGRWNYAAGGISSDGTTPSGTKVYSLVSGNLSLAGLSTAKTYIVSYWSKTGVKSVNGASAVVGMTLNGWTYYEHAIINPSSGTITLSGSGTVDEVRLYPKGGLMTSYTYEPLVGMRGQCDVKSQFSYFEYDGIGRLVRIRDQNKNILKKYEYKFNDVFNYPYGNIQIASTATKSCPSGYVSSVAAPYKVTANTYGSFLSQADADSKAQTEVNANGQAWADQTGICVPYYSWSVSSGWNGINNNFALSGTGSVNFSFVIAKQSGSIVLNTSYQVGVLTGSLFIPSGIRVFNVSEGGRTWQVQVLTNGYFYLKLLSGSIPSVASISGSYTL